MSAVSSQSAAARRALRRKARILEGANARMKVVSGEAATSSTAARNQPSSSSSSSGGGGGGDDDELDPALLARSGGKGPKLTAALHRSVTQVTDAPSPAPSGAAAAAEEEEEQQPSSAADALAQPPSPRLHRNVTQVVDAPASGSEEAAAGGDDDEPTPPPGRGLHRSVTQITDGPSPSVEAAAAEGNTGDDGGGGLLDAAIDSVLDSPLEAPPAPATSSSSNSSSSGGGGSGKRVMHRAVSQTLDVPEATNVGVVRTRKRPSRRKLSTAKLEEVMAAPSPTLQDGEEQQDDGGKEITDGKKKDGSGGASEGALAVALLPLRAAAAAVAAVRVFCSKPFQLALVPIWLGALLGLALLQAEDQGIRELLPEGLLPPPPPAASDPMACLGGDGSGGGAGDARARLEQFVGATGLASEAEDDDDLADGSLSGSAAGEAGAAAAGAAAAAAAATVPHALVVRGVTFMLSWPLPVLLLAAHVAVNAPYRLLEARRKAVGGSGGEAEADGTGGVMGALRKVMDTYRYAVRLFDDFCVLIFICLGVVAIGRVFFAAPCIAPQHAASTAAGVCK
jgi:hypothetical protein